jgi:DNA-binding GntR family transcriptional regulator
VAADLRAEIESGRLPAGAKLPSEPELSSVYGVARVTIRSAIGSLKDEGLVTVTLGRRTYVAKR